MYKARAWLAIAELLELECYVEGEKKDLKLGVRRGEAMGGLYRSLGLYREGNKPRTAMAMIHRRSKTCMQRLGANGVEGGVAAPWVRPHPQLLPLA